MSHPAQPLADAFHWWSHPQVARLVRFPTRENRRRQLAAVGWLAVYLGAVQDGLRLVDASRPDPHVYSRLLRDTIEGLLVGNRRSADELDLELRARNERSTPPHDLGPEARARSFGALADGGSYPQDALCTSWVLGQAVTGELAAALGIDVAAVQDLAQRQLAQARLPRVRNARVDPDGDGVTVEDLLDGFGRWLPATPWGRAQLAGWTGYDNEGYALVDSARSWGWVLRTANGIRADLGHGITRLLPSGRIRDPDFAEGHPIWAEETFRYANDAAVIGEGPGRLLLQSRYASPVTHPYPDDNPVWVLDVASGRMVRQAPTLWRFLRDR